MNELRFEALKKQLSAPANRPGELLARARAAKQLVEEGMFRDSPEELRQTLRGVLADTIANAERYTGWEAERTVNCAARVLDLLDAEDAAKVPEPCPFGSWKELPDEDARLAYLELDLLTTLAFVRGWDVTFQSHLQTRQDRRRIKWLEKEADKVLSAKDPLFAAHEALDHWWDRERVPCPRCDVGVTG